MARISVMFYPNITLGIGSAITFFAAEPAACWDAAPSRSASLPDMLLGNEGCYEFERIVLGWLALRMKRLVRFMARR